MKPKRPTDKELRLYASLSHVDGDLILDGVIPSAEAGKTVRASRKGMLSRPWAASLVLCAVAIALAVSLMMDMGLFRDPATEPSHSDTTRDVNRPPELDVPATPSMEAAATLHRGMSLSELFSVMGNSYTQDGHRYTFTLSTGESLTVSTAPDEAGETAITGFEWLGSAGKTYNPMGIPAEILQQVQEYATDRVIPVYAMNSLIGQYDSITPPNLDEILKDAELAYLRMAPDGETVIVNQDGMIRGGFPRGGDFSLLTEVSALFDDSVRVKAYYPILSSKERGAVYFQTSIGDYILYLHGESLPLTPEGLIGTADAVPYLMPAAKFHEFAHGVVSDQKHDQGMSWTFSDKRMAVIESCKMTAADYRKPINIATPEAADQVKKDMEHSAVVELLGPCLRCASESQVYAPDDPLANFSEKAQEGLHYWELTDGSGLVLYCRRKSSIHHNGANPPEYNASVPATDVIRVSSAEIIDILGTPTPATFALLKEGLSESCVKALLGSPLEPSLWKCMEENVVHTVKLTWKANSLLALNIASIDYTTVSVTDAAREIEIGMSFAAITARLGTCVCGHENGTHSSQINNRYHYWTLPDGHSLAIYIGHNVAASDSPFSPTFPVQHYNYAAMSILWHSSSEGILPVGTPSQSMAERVVGGMREEIVIALMGKPGHTEASLVSAWTWDEKGKTYTFTVYWNDNQPVGPYSNFRTVAHYELTETSYPGISFPEKEPSATDAAAVTVGISTLELLQIMGSGKTTLLGDAALYCWYVDNRVFCALAEPDVTDPARVDRIVTYTFYRDSMEDVSTPTPENMEAITEGMSMATVAALLGQPNIPNGLINSPIKEWITPEGTWWEIKVEFETVTHPETNSERTYVKTYTLLKSEP